MCVVYIIVLYHTSLHSLQWVQWLKQNSFLVNLPHAVANEYIIYLFLKATTAIALKNMVARTAANGLVSVSRRTRVTQTAHACTMRTTLTIRVNVSPDSRGQTANRISTSVSDIRACVLARTRTRNVTTWRARLCATVRQFLRARIARKMWMSAKMEISVWTGPRARIWIMISIVNAPKVG